MKYLEKQKRKIMNAFTKTTESVLASYLPYIFQVAEEIVDDELTYEQFLSQLHDQDFCNSFMDRVSTLKNS